MNCNDAAEFVSALCDGETVPRSAAEHIGTCEMCQMQMKDYLEIGAELRRIASVQSAEQAPPLIFEERQAWSMNWWQKGWGTMRIPRLVFAALLAVVAVLGSSLAVVGAHVHAHAQDTVVLLKSAPPGISSPSEPSLCALSTIDQKNDFCGYVGKVNAGWIVYGVRVLSSDGDRVELGVRSRFVPKEEPGSANSGIIDSLPEATYLFDLGKNLEVNVPGAGKITFSGEWTDHIPANVAGTSGEVDPGPGEARINSPLLLLDKKVVGDMEGASTYVNKTGDAVTIYYPGQGLFQFSPTQLPGAVPGRVQLNRITFESVGKSYTLVTGAPITREAQLWVAHYPDYRPRHDEDSGFLTSGDSKGWDPKEK